MELLAFYFSRLSLHDEEDVRRAHDRRQVCWSKDTSYSLVEVRGRKVKNVVGSSKDKRYTRFSPKSTSWLKCYYDLLGKCPAKCSISGCLNSADCGLHVHLEKPSCEWNYIIPGCTSCNGEPCFDGEFKRTKPGVIALKIPAAQEVCPHGRPLTPPKKCKNASKLEDGRLFPEQGTRIHALNDLLYDFLDLPLEDVIGVYFWKKACPACSEFNKLLNEARLPSRWTLVKVHCFNGKHPTIHGEEIKQFTSSYFEKAAKQDGVEIEYFPTMCLYYDGKLIKRNACGLVWENKLADYISTRCRMVASPYWSESSGSPSRSTGFPYTKADLMGMTLFELKDVVYEFGLDVATNTGGLYRRTCADIVRDILDAV